MTTRTAGRATDIDAPIELGGIALPPGLRLRRWRGLDADLPAMWAAADAARVADGEAERHTYEATATYYRHLERYDPATDLVLAEMDGEFAGYCRVEWNDSNDGERWYEGVGIVHPTFRRRGIGTVLLAWSERRRRAMAAAHDAAGLAREWPRALTTFLFDGDVGGRILLERAGYHAFRRFATMRRPNLEDLPSADLPAGLEVRPVGRDRDALRRIFDADSEAFRDHFGWTESTDEKFAEFLEQPDLEPELWVVAFDGDEVAGGVLNGIHVSPGGVREGWLDSVFTRRPWRRRGLARALIARSLAILAANGLDSAHLGVDTANVNDALALYESCGFRPISSATSYRRPLPEADTR